MNLPFNPKGLNYFSPLEGEVGYLFNDDDKDI